MKFVNNYMDCKLFGVRETTVFEQPDNKNPIDKLFADDIFKTNLSYVYWSTEELSFYKVTTPSGQEGYVRTDIIQLSTK